MASPVVVTAPAAQQVRDDLILHVPATPVGSVGKLMAMLVRIVAWVRAAVQRRLPADIGSPVFAHAAPVAKYFSRGSAALLASRLVLRARLASTRARAADQVGGASASIVNFAGHVLHLRHRDRLLMEAYLASGPSEGAVFARSAPSRALAEPLTAAMSDALRIRMSLTRC